MVIRKNIEYNINKIIKEKINEKIIINFFYNIKKRIKKKITNIKNIIAISSGKGGVGKSTFSSNISMVMSKMGFKVGLFDADIYGPSIPLIFNLKKINNIKLNNNKIIPIEKYGVKIISLGFFLKKNQSVLWKGPIAIKYLNKLIKETDWGFLDFLIIDFPPGTSDIHIFISSEFYINGTVVISTPQILSLSDVYRNISMFSNNFIKIPIIGIVENMSYFFNNEKKHYLFGKKTVKNFTEKLKLYYLGSIPIIENIRLFSDKGINIEKDIYSYNIYKKITIKIIKKILNVNKNLSKSEINNILNKIKNK
ncbi:P-loop NTPase [Candidatus Shikimatogenerans silvanidophilus]|uniref:P-loop NTPase n=1 Tax=Candidatus Shikimatogenerans silvanidophilus TaxID=2782547 RepID=UPI001F51676E|nr:P-loop NTPase [Candidatus Shikimatogenerans silvanidophilus]